MGNESDDVQVMLRSMSICMTLRSQRIEKFTWSKEISAYHFRPPGGVDDVTTEGFKGHVKLAHREPGWRKWLSTDAHDTIVL